MTRKLLKQDDGGDKAPVGPIAHRSPKSETDIDPIAAEHAEAIRSLGKRVVTDVIEIGRRLRNAKRLSVTAIGCRGWSTNSDGAIGRRSISREYMSWQKPNPKSFRI